ncbi:MAG: hypothetical protein U9R42_05580 [Bacteroidota bacterium]|nr:hypothetical protein [Bacteroidota bacterium]
MKKYRILALFIAFSFVIAGFSCDKDEDEGNEPNNEPTEDPTGKLDVYVHMSLPTGVLWGYAMVKLYESEEDRTNLITYDSNYTDGVSPFNAYFEKLLPQKYYIRATFEHQSELYEGLGELFVPINTTTSYHITAAVK